MTDVSSLQKMLEELHREVAKGLLVEVTKTDRDQRWYAEAIKFLKNNEITAVPVAGQPLGNLTDALPFNENDQPLASIGT